MKKIILAFCLFIIVLNVNAQRNVVLIIADDLSPDYFGFYENYVDTVDVPNIRALLKKGVRFKNFMTNPVCSSTRTTILTGRYSFRTGVGGIIGGIGGSNQIDTAEVTIPRLLKLYNSNIAKADIGKWHLTQPAPISHLMYPNIMGYDWFEGPFIGQLPSFTNWTKYTNGVASTITTYATTENVNNAVSWLKTINNKQFFLWLAFNAPHEPLHLPPSNLHTFNTLSGTQANINANPKPYFKAMIQAMDHEMGRLFDSLQMMNKLDSTDIIFIGDNGNTQKTAQISDLNKAKGTVYQYGVHTPLIISGPSVINPNRASDALINSADLFSTILELMGDKTWVSNIPTNITVDSKSILPIIKNTSSTIRPWAFSEIFKLTSDSSDGKGMRNVDYKLIKFDYGAQEFYNLTLDPNESHNLLDTTMTATDISNYNYLCNEMLNLIGSGTACKNFPSGVNDESRTSNQFIIEPNPVQHQLKIKILMAGFQRIEIQNTVGQTIKIIETNNSTSTNFEVDVADLKTGIYLLRVGNQTQKFIKE